MNLTFFFTLVSILTVIYIIIGVIASRKISNTEDYFLAGRQLGVLPLAFTLIATQLGGGVLLGTCEEAYNSGLYGIFYTLGICIGFIVLALGFAAKLRDFNVATIAELLGRQYKSPILQRIASVLSIISLSGILVGTVIASRKFLLAIGIEYDAVLYMFWGALIIYTVCGGLKALVLIDSLQVGVIILVFIVVFGYVYYGNIDLFSFREIKAISSIQDSNMTSKLIGMLLMPIFFSLVEQDLAQRFFSARNKRVAVMGSAIAGIFLLLFSLIPVIIGAQARILDINIPQGASVLIITARALASDTVTSLICCAVLAAIISTADSLLCAISSNLSQDFTFTRKIGNISHLNVSKFITLLVGITVVAIGTFFDDILAIYIKSYAITVCGLFVPLVFCFFKVSLYKSAALLATGMGVLAFVLMLYFYKGSYQELIALTISLAVYYLEYFRQKNKILI